MKFYSHRKNGRKGRKGVKKDYAVKNSRGGIRLQVMDSLNAAVYLIGPFFSQKAGLSYESFGELLKFTRELGPGRYPIMNADGKTFHLVLYEDGSWRLSTSQLEIFPDCKVPQSLT